MRRGKHRKFGRETKQRRALYKSLATALIEHGRIKTTVAKSKALSSYMDKLISTARKGDLASRKSLGTNLGPKAASKLAGEISPKFKERSGGFTRVVRLGQRKSDGAPMALIEFTQ
ncbi:MAG: 50S ribosomal protein L17 [Candidatus Yanofskybacteria bacterium RIFCSPHIGHO2_02_FULL_44_12b]|uniref:50S ribosomal protein L17 n=1 Tax=Candidatus Yanofskybacteria bacterium GW2011_GWA2_44_9 TaxID=1619025 RepID=A0A0G1KB84_9BACT|nr:MAG: 50S ribosomal protein L17 [Candidatus Yanofskybacteria bacterium GW2011_GWA2_44_9]OGN04937.1 MAG: 50S ribosomal protein L17 [Candidatus Yanofskybacteria bacterium RIFCSPHIGHO2_01_FULL_44_24]OGN16156.1 MAG: 50S ribosomal protein L17 [Candidatus Yanofskybacteria bacterium RIFCSPHIGHO2_02_FULL_44_12b]